MDTQNLGGLSLAVAGSGVDLADAVLFELPETDRKISSGSPSLRGIFPMIRVPELANFREERNGVDIGFPEPESWCVRLLQFADIARPRRVA